MQATKKSNKKVRTIPLWSLLAAIPFFMILGALCVLWYWQTHKDAIIRDKIEEAIQKKTQGLYNVQYESTGMDEFKGDLSFYNIDLAFDPAAYLEAEKKGVAPPILFKVHVPEISVTGVEASRAMNNNEIIGKKLFIKKPIIDLFYTYKGKDASITMPTNELYKEILGGLKLVQVDTIFLSDASIRTISNKTGKVLAEGNNISITLADVKIDSTAFEDRSRLMFSKNININVDNIRWASGNKLYNYTIGKINLNSANRTMSVGHFNMNPGLDENAFMNATPAGAERYNISLAGISFSNIDAKKVLNGDVYADALHIPNLSLKIYTDQAKPKDNKSKIGKYPHQVLDDIPLPFDIKKVTISGGHLEYKERNKITRQSGTVSFHHLNGVVSNLTNNKNAAGQKMTAHINAKLLGQAAFSSRWNFYLFHPRGRFDLSGSLGPMDATFFNPLIQASGPATIREGKLDGLNFSLHGSDHKMEGTVKMLYRDLKVDLFNNKKEGDKKTMGSFLANMILKNSNPNKNEKVREMNVSMTRDPSRSMFWLCWKTIFKGISETVGIKKDQRTESNNKQQNHTNN